MKTEPQLPAGVQALFALPPDVQQKIVIALLDSVLAWDRWLTDNGARCRPLEAEFHGMTIRYLKGVIKLWRRSLLTHP